MEAADEGFEVGGGCFAVVVEVGVALHVGLHEGCDIFLIGVAIAISVARADVV